MSCENGHSLDYITRRCRRCGKRESLIVKANTRTLKSGIAVPRTAKGAKAKKVKGVVGS